MLRGTCRYSIFGLKIDLVGNPLTHHELEEKLASGKMTTGCVLEAPKIHSVQLTEMSVRAIRARVIWKWELLSVEWNLHVSCKSTISAALLIKVFTWLHFINPAHDPEPVGCGQSWLRMSTVNGSHLKAEWNVCNSLWAETEPRGRSQQTGCQTCNCFRLTWTVAGLCRVAGSLQITRERGMLVYSTIWHSWSWP